MQHAVSGGSSKNSRVVPPHLFEPLLARRREEVVMQEDDGMPFINTCSLRVRYSETDKMGIVYNANYLSWFEVARTELCRRFGRPYREWEEQGYNLPVVEAHCVYKSPCAYDDVVLLFCRMPRDQIKPHSVVFEYRIMREPGCLLAEGWTKHAFVNAELKIYRKDNFFQKWLVEETEKYIAENSGGDSRS
jgi:acyl-CoA thioester hydrolase